MIAKCFKSRSSNKILILQIKAKVKEQMILAKKKKFDYAKNSFIRIINILNLNNFIFLFYDL